MDLDVRVKATLLGALMLIVIELHSIFLSFEIFSFCLLNDFFFALFCFRISCSSKITSQDVIIRKGAEKLAENQNLNIPNKNVKAIFNGIFTLSKWPEMEEASEKPKTQPKTINDTHVFFLIVVVNHIEINDFDSFCLIWKSIT